MGLAIGIALAAAAARAIRSMLYGIGPLDPVAYAAMASAMVIAAGLAMLLPSRRAGRIDPASEMREQ